MNKGETIHATLSEKFAAKVKVALRAEKNICADHTFLVCTAYEGVQMVIHLGSRHTLLEAK